MLLEKTPDGRDEILFALRHPHITRMNDDNCEVGSHGQEIPDIAERGEGGWVEIGEGVGLEVQVVVGLQHPNTAKYFPEAAAL